MTQKEEFRNDAYEILQHYKFGRIALEDALDELCDSLPKKIKNELTKAESIKPISVELGGKNLEQGYELLFEIKISDDLRDAIVEEAARRNESINTYLMNEVEKIFQIAV